MRKDLFLPEQFVVDKGWSLFSKVMPSIERGIESQSIFKIPLCSLLAYSHHIWCRQHWYYVMSPVFVIPVSLCLAPAPATVSSVLAGRSGELQPGSELCLYRPRPSPVCCLPRGNIPTLRAADRPFHPAEPAMICQASPNILMSMPRSQDQTFQFLRLISRLLNWSHILI